MPNNETQPARCVTCIYADGNFGDGTIECCFLPPATHDAANKYDFGPICRIDRVACSNYRSFNV